MSQSKKARKYSNMDVITINREIFNKRKNLLKATGNTNKITTLRDRGKRHKVIGRSHGKKRSNKADATCKRDKTRKQRSKPESRQ